MSVRLRQHLQRLLFACRSENQENSLPARLLWGPSLAPPSQRFSRWLFLRALAVVQFVAFLSLATQIVGLSGSEGLVPAAELLEHARKTQIALLDLPTLCWWLGGNDGALTALCAVGMGLSVLIALGLAQPLLLLAQWAIYLSLFSVCRPFLSFQWDTLLLETTLVAALWAPLNWRPRLPGTEAAPSRWSSWLVRFLLFRLMFSSGIVKMISGDAAWIDHTALTFHFQTQPLPSGNSWAAHHLPFWMHQYGLIGMFIVELVLPFAFLLPRRPRRIAAWATIWLMLLINITGNYGFFGLLTVALCVAMFDDAQLPKWLRRCFLKATAAEGPTGGPGPTGPLHRWLVALPVGMLIVLGALSLARTLRCYDTPTAVERALSPLALVNSYGLFAVMTKRRPEIIIEGSEDGKDWKAYEFRYKPGALKRQPRFSWFHMPRLDWQMWFAALGSPQRNLWVRRLLDRLQQGSRTVLALLQTNPFPSKPPRFLRATRYDYRFSSEAERAEKGRWWQRKYESLYDVSSGTFGGSR